MIETFKIAIPLSKEERQIQVYLPKKYKQETKQYPVLYMHDGQNVFFDDEAIGGTSLNLYAYLEAQELDVIVVAIDQDSEERLNEYCPWTQGAYSRKVTGDNREFGGKGSAYIDAIVHIIKPYIDNTYRTLPNKTAMAGISLGGLITTYAMCKYPLIFNHIAVFSSAFFRNQEAIEQLILDTNLDVVQSIYMDTGDKEAGTNISLNKCFAKSNQTIYSLLQSKVPQTLFRVFPNAEHDYAFFKERIPNLFSFLTYP